MCRHGMRACMHAQNKQKPIHEIKGRARYGYKSSFQHFFIVHISVYEFFFLSTSSSLQSVKSRGFYEIYSFSCSMACYAFHFHIISFHIRVRVGIEAAIRCRLYNGFLFRFICLKCSISVRFCEPFNVHF